MSIIQQFDKKTHPRLTKQSEASGGDAELQRKEVDIEYESLGVIFPDNCYLWEWLLVYKSEKTSPITRIQINQSSVIERKGIYSNISEINKNKQYILYVLPLI